MRLLVPRERDSLEQKEQERRVLEATQTAGRLDSLKEQEESSKKKLQEFQEREFRNFQVEKEKRDSLILGLDAAIKAKKAELAEFFEKNPIDKKWLLFVKEEKAKIEEGQRKSAELLADLALKAQEQAIKEEGLAKRESNLRKDKITFAGIVEKKEKELSESKRESIRLREEVNILNQSARKSLESAQEIENKAKIKFRETEIKSENLDRREKELEDREMQVLVKELQYYSPVKQT